MTANVPLVELVPGDQVLDLVAAGTVKRVEPIQHSIRRVSATRVTFEDDTFIVGPHGYTVVTMREAVDA